MKILPITFFYKFLLILSTVGLLNTAFPLTPKETKHLLIRTSFGYRPSDLIKFKAFSKSQAVDYLIKQASSKNLAPFPKELRLALKHDHLNYKKLTRSDKDKIRKNRRKTLVRLTQWWLTMMSEPEFSFREKMTLFWHNHFVSEYRVVKDPYLMYLQNTLYRENAVGNFAHLLNQSSKDLAMLIYLDSNLNKQGNPNENYARELLELFTMGEGNGYTEKDIKEVARAFTGWRVNKKKGKFKKVKKFHDGGEKTFMGDTGKFDGEDIIRLILQKPQVSEFIVSKLYREFIGEKVNSTLVKKVAKQFRSNNSIAGGSYQINLALRELLLSDDFWLSSKSPNQVMIKSPVELYVGLIKQLDLKMGSDEEWQKNLKQLKNLQELFNPPDVKGWLGGSEWITTDTLIKRQALMRRVVIKQLNHKKIKSLIKQVGIKDVESLYRYFFPTGERMGRMKAGVNLIKQYSPNLLKKRHSSKLATKLPKKNQLAKWLTDLTYQLK